MGRLILAVIGIFIMLCFCYSVVAVSIKQYKAQKEEYKNDEPTHLIQKNGLLQPSKTDVDYWYEKPHWYVLPNGKKINLSEYMTYEEYKSYSKPRIAQMAMEIAYRLEQNEKDNNGLTL